MGAATVQHLSVACACTGSACNQNVGSAIQSAFAWTMPQATMPTTSLHPVITEVADYSGATTASQCPAASKPYA